MIDLWMKNEEAKVDKKLVQHLKDTTNTHEQLAIEDLRVATTFSDNGFIDLSLKAAEGAVKNMERDLYEDYD